MKEKLLWEGEIEWASKFFLLKELDGNLLDNIKEKREKYREEYSFTKYEIDPQLKETITNLSPNESVH